MGISFSQSTYTVLEGQNDVVVCLEANVTLPQAIQALITATELQNVTGELLPSYLPCTGVNLRRRRLLCLNGIDLIKTVSLFRVALPTENLSNALSMLFLGDFGPKN